jgi:uncharacterized protein involved in exopolysaccharide biosynthesis
MEFAGILRRKRRTIMWTMICFSVVAGVWQRVFPKEYKASVLVSIAADDRSRLGGLSSIVSQLGPLASLAGAAGIGVPQKSEAMAVLKSHFLIQKFISENNLLPILYESATGLRKLLRSLSPHKEPTLWRASQYFEERIRHVSQDSKTGLITLNVTWRDPKIAAMWANGLIEITNRYLREKAIAESQRHIAFLTDQAAQTTLVELHTAVSTLIANEVKQSMMAKGSEEFALVVIDPAVVPEEPSSPGFVLCLFVGALAGIAISVFGIYLVTSLRREMH